MSEDLVPTPPDLTSEQRAHLNGSEWDLLRWLAKEDFSQYGECYGKDLDSLIAKGLAQHHQDTGFSNTFIAKGRGVMFDKVSLTEAGYEVLRENPENRRSETCGFALYGPPALCTCGCCPVGVSP